MLTYQTDGWTALGDPTRRAIFERVAEHPRAVGELASELPVSRPAVSQHLKVLKEAGLEALRAQLDRFWTKALANYKAAAEQSTEEVS